MHISVVNDTKIEQRGEGGKRNEDSYEMNETKDADWLRTIFTG
jgi:hypothetical protein